MSVEHKFLVLVEVVKVKGFLFSSSKLKSMRGASYVLDKLNLQRAKEIFKTYQENNQAKKIYFAGANNKALFKERTKAEEFVKRLRREYEQNAPGVKLVSVILARKADESMSSLMQRGMSEVIKNKNEGFAKNISANPFAKYCPICGDSLVNRYSNRNQTDAWLCIDCDEKIKNGNEINQIKKDMQGDKGFDEFIYNMFYKRVAEKFPEFEDAEINLAETIGDIADDNNYIGFIYADGNRIGSFLQKFNSEYLKDITDEDEYIKLQQLFSNALDGSTKGSVIEAVIEHFATEIKKSLREKNTKLPIEFILAGADDLIMIVPGDRAIKVAKTFVEKFEADINKRLGDDKNFAKVIDSGVKITTSAGIAISKPSYPASFLFDYSAQLLKQAKVRSNTLYQSYIDEAGMKANYCTIDFDIIGDSSIRKIKEKRKEIYQQGDTYLSLRPYLVDQREEKDLSELLYIDHLIETVTKLKHKKFPKVKLRQFFDALQLEKNEAILESLRLSKRLSNNEHQSLIKELYQQRAEKHGVFPWVKLDKDAKMLVTDMLDIVETYDFV